MSDARQKNPETCRCGKRPANPPHGCPYACEINDECDDDHCTCCDECTNNCRDDI